MCQGWHVIRESSQRRFGFATGVTGLLVVLTAVAPVNASGATGGHVARWKVFPGATTMRFSSIAIDDRARILYSFSQPGGSGPVIVQASDLDRGSKLSPPLALPDSFPLSASTPIAVDPVRHTVVVAESQSSVTAPKFIVAKLSHGAMSVVGAVATRFSPGYSVVGIDIDTRHGLLYALAEPTGCVTSGVCATVLGAGVGAVRVDAMTLTGLARGQISSPYAVPLEVPQACGEVMTNYFPAGIVVSSRGDKAFFGCVSNRGAVTPLGPNVGDVSGVGELDLAAGASNTAGAFAIHPIPGDFGKGDSIAVPGQGRLLLVAPAAGAMSLRVYDAVHGYFVGSVGVDANVVFGVGVDAASGEGYFVDPTGITAVDLSALPVPQGSADPTFVAMIGAAVARPVVVDSRTHRVFVIGSEDPVDGTSPFVAVLAGSAGLGASDPLGSTQVDGIDAPEIPGVTDSARVVTVGAAGAEERLVGGPADLIQNTTHVNTGGIATRPGTRDIRLGVLSGVQLTNDEATALAVTEIQDDATTNDARAQTPQAPDQVPSDIQKQYQQYQFITGDGPPIPVQCVDFAASPTTASAESESVSCDHNGQHVTAAATGEPGRILLNAPCKPAPGTTTCTPTDLGKTVPNPVSVKSASSTVDVVRHGNGPMTTTITSEADGIDIMGVVRIGRVTAKATLTAHGRSGTAKVEYTRTITGLIVNGTTVCTTDCPLTTVAAAIKTALGGRGHVDLPNATIIQAPNGRLAFVQDNPYHHVEQVLFDNVSDDNVLFPVMSITVYLDESTASREHVNLAAIGGQEIYRIFRPGSYVSGGGPDKGNLVSVGGRLAGAGAVAANSPFVAAPNNEQPQGTPTGIAGVISRAMHLGLRSPGDIAGVAILWMLLAVPAYLAARRRLLLDLPRLTPKGNS